MSARPEFKGDYMGFTYNNKHSSELGIVRVSEGSRFNENLLPTMQDKTVQVPGGDGTYYFGSYYTQRQFNVSFAFDDLTEAEIGELKRHFGDKGEHDLIFDETPYKVWRAKVTGTATIKYIPFAEGANNRLYKGEGTIQFTCYYPFARCWSTDKEKYANHPAYKDLDNETREARINEWWASSRIENEGNFGDVPVPFTVIINGTSGNIYNEKISWDGLPTLITINGTQYEARGRLDTRIGVVTQEYKKNNKWEKSGQVLNQYMTGDLTIKIPVGETVTSNLSFTCEYI